MLDPYLFTFKVLAWKSLRIGPSIVDPHQECGHGSMNTKLANSQNQKVLLPLFQAHMLSALLLLTSYPFTKESVLVPSQYTPNVSFKH